MKYPISKKQINEYSPIPLYFITTNRPEELTYDAFYSSLLNLKAAQFGGIVLFNKPQGGFAEEEYLGEAFFGMVKNAASACKDLGLKMWINDGYDFPPGAVAGRIKKAAPQLKQRRIRLINGKPTVECVEWGFPAFEEDLSGELFRKFVYEEYDKHVGEFFGDTIKGFFSDTDNRRVLPPAMFDESSPMRDYFPWSSTFEADFKAEYGYDITPYMADILQRKSVPQSMDYWEFCGRLYQKWWCGNAAWLRAHGLEYTGHSSDSSPYLQSEACRSSCFTEGRFSDAQRHFDYPGTDQELYAIDGGKHMTIDNMYTPKVVWGEEMTVPKMTDFAVVKSDLRAKQTASTAFLYDKKGVMCEMFAASNYGVEPSVLLHIAAYQIMQGVTFVVPHAYHHKFRGEIKYFAPPEYSENSLLKHSVDVINRKIAALTCMMSKGEPVYPVALIDPTEYVWLGEYDKNEYFDAFAHLNRLPYGFVICDAGKLINNDYGFKAAVYAGINPTDEIKNKIENKGIKLFSYKDIDKLGGVIKPDVCYEGEGTPHFQRRIIDGEEFTFIANIESEKAIKGKIKAYGKEKELYLYPGDIRYVSKTYDDIPEPEKNGEYICAFPDTTPVKFDSLNCIPLEYFTSDGKTVTKTGDEKKITFSFTAKDALNSLKFCIPDDCLGIIEKVVFNGTECLCGEKSKVFDDDYTVYSLFAVKGANTIELIKNGAVPYYDRILLTGEFDAEIITDKRYYKKAIETYNLSVYIPEKAEVMLDRRRAVLSTLRSAVLQGQPFYSGGITYRFNPVVNQTAKYRLIFPLIRDTVYLTVNGKPYGKTVKPPYSFEFELENGENEILLTVYNSLANSMECYLEPGGIVSHGILVKI